MFSKALVIFLALLDAAEGAGVKIDAMKHDIQGITGRNFDGVIGTFRDTAVSSLWFYKSSSAADEKFLDLYNSVAADLKGMAKVCAVDCEESPKFCKDNQVTETPAVNIYPVNPMPPFRYEGKMESKPLTNRISKLFPDMSTVVKSDNADIFLTTDPSKPKVLLFSAKNKVPTILKALSSETVFKRSIKFGFVSAETAKDIADRFSVNKFPTVMMVRGAKMEIKETYTGEMSFSGLKDWVNLYSESGMGDKVGAGGKEEVSIEEAKPWLLQEVPEVHSKSIHDVCLKGEGLCVIYLKDGHVTMPETEMLTGLSKKFTSQLSDRGAKMKWMWMNLAIEENMKKLFSPAHLPSAAVFNPHKRLRFTLLDHGEDGEVKGDEAGLTSLMDKVLGGDARFKMVPGQKLPAWAARDEGKKEL